MNRTNNRKPKVLHIGYHYNPAESGRGGVIVYQWSLVEALARSGWDVCLFVGSRHTLFNKMHTRTKQINNVKIIELVNSPLRHCDYRCNPTDYLFNKEIDHITEQVLDSEKPDIVHIHDPRLHSASILEVIKSRNIPMLKTIHNYFDLCQQGELMYKGSFVCRDYQDGSKCVECLSSFPQKSFFKEKVSGTLDGSLLFPISRQLWRGYKSIKRMKQGNGDNNGKQTFPPESYVRRRRSLVKKLNLYDKIHCSSKRSADILTNAGVEQTRISVIPLSTSSVDKIKLKPLREIAYPVTFGYLTGETYIKGYNVLLDAFSTLDQQKAKLMLFGFQDADYYNNTYGNLNVEFRRPYRSEDINEILSMIDVGVVPSIWEEIFGIVGVEFLSANIPVIGSNIGGTSEWLSNGNNGLLVRSNDSVDLAEKMRLLVDKPELVSGFQKHIKPWKSMEKHKGEIVEVYDELMKYISADSKNVKSN